ncbi:MAG: class I SAM-dependent methyltransferase [Bacteroidota bacterium]|nr:class I SAM-dependent methyltransferase [Bacteroidota bacterium]
MQYDPIKKSLGKVFNKKPFLRKFFYNLLDLLLLRAWYVKRELRKWKKSSPQDVKILDAGAGFGQYSFFMSKLGRKFNILGVEVKKEQIDDCNSFFKQIKQDQRVKFDYADLTNFKRDKEFDLILSVDVMEHIEEDVKVFENFYASLKDDGLLLISTPSHLAEDHDHDHDYDEHDGKEISFVDEHVRDGYFPDEIFEKLQKSGFKNVSVKYSYGTPGKIAWVLSMKIPIIVLNISQLFFILLPFYYIITYPFAFILNWVDTLFKHKKGGGLLVKAKKN